MEHFWAGCDFKKNALNLMLYFEKTNATPQCSISGPYFRTRKSGPYFRDHEIWPLFEGPGNVALISGPGNLALISGHTLYKSEAKM